MKNSNAYLVVGADSLVGASLIKALKAKGHKTYGLLAKRYGIRVASFLDFESQRHLLLHMMFHMLL